MDGIVDFPCIRKCCLNEDDICLGCFRSLDEIMRWSEADQAERRSILQVAQARCASHGRRYGESRGEE